MYSDYEIENNYLKSFPNNPSILEKFPQETAILIAQQTVLSLKNFSCNCNTNIFGAKSLQHSTGSTKDSERDRKEFHPFVSKPHSVVLNTECEVNWAFEVLKYSVTIPLINYLDVIKHAIHIYCSWITYAACDDSSSEKDISSNLPQCVKDYPNEYICQILSIFSRFFKNFVDEYGIYYNANYSNQTGEVKQEMSHVAKELNSVIDMILNCVEKVATQSIILTETTWDSLIYFTLYVTNVLLVDPNDSKNMIATLSDRISTTLFRIWLQACSKCFPRPSLWKTFSQLSKTWRHQEAFINQWNNINFSFTARLLGLINNTFPKVPEVDEATEQLIPDDLTDACIKDCWYRFLHLIGNPVDLCQPKLAIPGDIIDTNKKKISTGVQATITNLSHNFHRAMHGLSIIVDAFLGLDCSWSGFSLTSIPAYSVPISKSNYIGTEPSPPENRRAPTTLFPIRKGKSVMTRNPNSQNMESQIPIQRNPTSDLNIELMPEPHPERPNANSLLKLFGNWLFEAASVGVQNIEKRRRTFPYAAITARAAKIEPSRFNAGRAEACGALCRIISHSNRTDISMEYLSKFYIVLYFGLDIEPATASSLVLSSILFNTTELLRIGLTGVNVLVPRLFRAVQFVLTNDMEHLSVDDEKKPHFISKIQLRRAAINQLFSLVSLPTHFISLEIKSLVSNTNMTEKKESYGEIRKQLSSLLSDNIRNECDTKNLQMLLGCLMAYLENIYRDENTSASENHKKSKEATPGDKIDRGSDTFNHALGLLSIHLVHKWKDDVIKLQHAIEALSDMALLKFRNIDSKICIRSVRFVCELIENQMNRESKEHSRQLHNIIISAYYCLATWMVHHPYLLDEKECMDPVLEICELGISGQKSKTISNGQNANIPKNFKKSQPTSKRVQVVAEYLIQCIMSVVGAFPGPFGAETMSSLVKEDSIIKYCIAAGDEVIHTDAHEASHNFRYFGLDNDVIMALFEKRPLSNSSSNNVFNNGVTTNTVPSIFVILRTCYGRFVWEMKSMHFPKEYLNATGGINSVKSSPPPPGSGPAPTQITTAAVNGGDSSSDYQASDERVDGPAAITTSNSSTDPIGGVITTEHHLGGGLSPSNRGESVLTGKLFQGRPFNTGIFKELLHIPNASSCLNVYNDTNGNIVDCEPSHFPDFVCYMEHFKVEQSIPKLESLMDDSEKRRIEAAIINNVNVTSGINRTCAAQRKSASTSLSSLLGNKETAASSTRNKQHQQSISDIQTARLLLYQLGYLSVNSFIYTSRPSSWLLPDDHLSPSGTNNVGVGGVSGIDNGSLATGLPSITTTPIAVPSCMEHDEYHHHLDNNNGDHHHQSINSDIQSDLSTNHLSSLNNNAAITSTSVTSGVGGNSTVGALSSTSNNNTRDDILPNITPLDITSTSFFTELDLLDRTPARSTDTCLVYYVKQGQKTCQEIWANHSEWPNMNTDFLALLLTLGWLVDVKNHPGWTGNIQTSFQHNWDCSTTTNLNTSVPGSGPSHRFHTKSASCNTSPQQQTPQSSTATTPLNTGSNVAVGTIPPTNSIPREILRLLQNHSPPDGTHNLIYWADSLTEIAFLIAPASPDHQISNKLDDSPSTTALTPTSIVQPTIPTISSSSSLPSTLKASSSTTADKFLLYGNAVSMVWLEDWDDLEKINVSDLIGCSSTSSTQRNNENKCTAAIIICPVPNGLFRVKVHRPSSGTLSTTKRHFSAGPLHTGMLLDLNNCGALIRHTIIHINCRIRQDSEQFYASHLARSQRIQHLIQEHRCLATHSTTIPLLSSPSASSSAVDFYFSLIQQPAAQSTPSSTSSSSSSRQVTSPSAA